jgi:hypothetical protein
MPNITANGFKALVASAFLVAAIGGIWRGIASCGGYVWHSQAMLAALVVVTLSVLLFAPSQGPSFPRRAILAFTVIGTFFAIRALSAPFYPAFPGFGDYFRQVGMALSTGPC